MTHSHSTTKLANATALKSLALLQWENQSGLVVEDLHFELDKWSLQEIVNLLKGLGYKGYAKLWWNKPGMELKLGLKELKSDGDAVRMARALVTDSVKHGIVYAVDGYREGNGVEITSMDPDYVPDEGEDSGLIEVEVDAESEPSTEEDRFDDSADDGEHEDYFGFDVEDGVDGGQANAFGGFNSPLNQEATTDKGAEDNDAPGEMDEEIGDISDGYETEDMDSYEGDSDDMIKKKRFLKYDEAEMCREYQFRVGLEFKTLSQFKEAIKEHALLNGRDVRYKKNDKLRCRVVCKGQKGKCKWICFASKVGGSDCFRIKTLKGKHTCGRSYTGRLASSEWISKKIVNNISRGEDMRLATIIQTIQDKYMANVSELKFEVHHKNRIIMEMFVVDLLAGTCSCRFWGLSGMPCPHACSAIFEKGDNPEEYCSNYYSPAAYLATYGKSIAPINRENMWPKVNCDTIIPPVFRVKPGRPRMVRIREPDENRSQTKYRRTGTSVTCSNCGQYGHNRRHCPNPIVSAPEPAAAASDVATDSAAPGNNAHDSGSAARGRGRGRGAGLGRGRGKGRGTVVTAPTPNTLAAEFGSATVLSLTGSGSANDSPLAGSGSPDTGAASNPLHTPATQPTPFIEPLIHQTPQVAPVTQPLPKTRTFGMRRSERLKMGIRKGAAKPAEHIDLTDD
ncbi:hypothetical protein Ahy_B05g075696 [Arachis hypogaea]|uniref:CCHC-type domain-containing protein n=1 Tax=Arachis hypogaea TaxID=3818 RepID=A0A444Z1S6_ARAHY|nr:hypothetical protein Ahy_B05g075696 [Arachis hypogaea]